jgi:poly-gamma-glutamate synthase PgsB/CapB
MKLILLLLLLITSLGLYEMARHRYHRRRVRIRIHVNGSRGKSSVTRLIAAGLRAGGIRTVAKTTGSAACLIDPDGGERPIPRRGAANIREQLAVFRQATAARADALVLECMAIRPDLQEVCERQIVQATIGVICNVRPDHLEVMGPRLLDVATSLARTVPNRGHLIYGDDDHFADLFAQRARAGNSRLTVTRAAEVTATEMGGFGYEEFPENVSLALAACESAGVARSLALAGMYDARPDIGALRRWRVTEGGKPLEFINAFAANDPVSYVRIWQRLGLNAYAEKIVLLLNIRRDRQRRSKDLAPLLGRELCARRYLLIGQPTFGFTESLKRQGLPAGSIEDLRGHSAAAVWQRACELAATDGILVGVGNIAGVGAELLRLLPDKERPA